MFNFNVSAIVVQVGYLLCHGGHDFGLVVILPANFLGEEDGVDLLHVVA